MKKTNGLKNKFLDKPVSQLSKRQDSKLANYTKIVAITIVGVGDMGSAIAADVWTHQLQTDNQARLSEGLRQRVVAWPA